jgi:hypothetical protein
LIPLTTISTCWLPHCEHTSRSRPIEDRGVGAVSLRKFSELRLDLMPATTAPDDQPELGFRRVDDGRLFVFNRFFGS